MGRMKYLWGSDAKEFRLEIWNENGVSKSLSPFKFAAFQVSALTLMLNLLKKYL